MKLSRRGIAGLCFLAATVALIASIWNMIAQGTAIDEQHRSATDWELIWDWGSLAVSGLLFAVTGMATLMFSSRR